MDIQYRGTAGFPPNAITFRALNGDSGDLDVRYEPDTATRLASVYLLNPANVLRQETWTQHCASTFEREARRHALRRVADGVLPMASVGRWWRTGRKAAEFDVVGWIDDSVVFVGEAKWSAAERVDLLAARVRERALEVFGRDDIPVATWTRGARRKSTGQLAFTMDEMAKP